MGKKSISNVHIPKVSEKVLSNRVKGSIRKAKCEDCSCIIYYRFKVHYGVRTKKCEECIIKYNMRSMI